MDSLGELAKFPMDLDCSIASSPAGGEEDSTGRCLDLERKSKHSRDIAIAWLAMCYPTSSPCLVNDSNEKARLCRLLCKNLCLQKQRQERIERNQNCPLHLTALMPRTWFTGGRAEKIARQEDKLQIDIEEERCLRLLISKDSLSQSNGMFQSLEDLELEIEQRDLRFQSLEPLTRRKQKRRVVSIDENNQVFLITPYDLVSRGSNKASTKPAQKSALKNWCPATGRMMYRPQ